MSPGPQGLAISLFEHTVILIDAQHLSASRPNRPLFTGVDLTVSTGDRVGVVGLNGCGKSTLLRLLARLDEPESGVVRWGRGARVGLLPQQPLLPAGTVQAAVGPSWQAASLLDRLGMAGMAPVHTSELSGGQGKRVALAALLAADHEVLILDEPTNHLDLDGIAFLEQWLAAFRGGLVMVTHDRHVLDALTTKVLEIDRGRAYVHVPAGRHAGSGYAAYLEGRALREELAESAEQARRQLASRELAWLRRGAPARTSKPKARIATATALITARPDAPARAGALHLELGAQRLGSTGVELEGVRFGWRDGDAPVLDGVTIGFEPGDRVGVVGANGAGKSTLLDVIAGRAEPWQGVVRRGATVRIGYYDQLGRQLDGDGRVRDAVAGDKGEPSHADVALMRRFWFDGDAQFAPIRLLSGGERRRLQLLLTLIEQPNVLLLDEPTNDLDLDTLRALEDFLDGWPGIVVAVSHDRSFLDRVTDELLVLDGRGAATWQRGGVAAWLDERSAAAVAQASGRPAPSTPSSSRPGTAAGSATASAALSAAPSPSTIRRRLGVAERDIATAAAARDRLAADLAAVTDHRRLAELGEQLTAAQARLDAEEAVWLQLAAEAEARGLDI
jgi:ATP-binding cassette subfamily F protein uup